MAEPFLSEIRLVTYTYAPKGWALCNGQSMKINQNQALFSLMGTYYGGDGRQTFCLPDLRDRAVIGYGQGPGLSNYAIGDEVGSPEVTLSAGQVSQHAHGLLVSSAAGTQVSPVGNYPAVAASGMGFVDGATKSGGAMPALVSAGGAFSPLPHENHQPFVVLNYIIALVGIFPSRN